MKINQNTVLEGKKVVLVPYTSAHVPRYHDWMKSEELQRLTASEPLSLEQEYEMQCSWREDADKCTFIILDAEKWSSQKASEEDCMVGDVNLFLTNSEDPTVGEIEIMIAGTLAPLFLVYWSVGITHLGLTTFEAKIKLENETSIGMFKKIHFKEVGVNNIFQEMTLKLIMDEQEKQWLLEQTNGVIETKYNAMKLHHNCDS
uniref:N-acetyltransferase 9 n=1 Tax=Pseudonaja textilis TaxID=8673 RepID=A0A670XN64_PSETE